MGCCYRSIQFLVMVFLFASIGLVVAACSIDYWWVWISTTITTTNLNARTGLWRSCTEFRKTLVCQTRDDIFQFSRNKDFDIILVSLCASGVCYVVAFILGCVTFAQKYPTKCLILVANIVTFIGAGISIFAIAWCILRVSREPKVFSWGLYCLFAETGLCILTFFLLLFLLCMTAPNPYHATRKDDEIVMLSR